MGGDDFQIPTSCKSEVRARFTPNLAEDIALTNRDFQVEA